ncbi:MAG: 50S ribosomal protein L18 [Anaerolineae bacterium]|nr:50S ribosomal protein L18 [Anaerolineae bacterium]
MAKKNRNEARIRRHKHVRIRVKGTAEKPRLNVFRSLAETYAQIIDDVAGQTLVAASTVDRELRESVKGLTKTDQARLVGKLLGERASQKGITRVVFDRGGFRYIGRVKALAEAARETGLQF